MLNLVRNYPTTKKRFKICNSNNAKTVVLMGSIIYLMLVKMVVGKSIRVLEQVMIGVEKECPREISLK
jgi:hypothetical protein